MKNTLERQAEIHAIVAMDKKKAIGKEGKLPWHLSSELKHFKELTMGHPMVLGRTTFEGFTKPLPGRDHLVLSKNKITSPFENVYGFISKEELLHFCQEKKYEKVFICGGESIYQLFANEIRHWHISEIDMVVQGADTYFPNDVQRDFSLVSSKKHKDEKTQIIWEYKHYFR
jgi:dihydrofolate reductase